MLFSSQPFILIFLPLALIAFYLAAASYTARLGVLVAASFIFYGWWDLRFLPLLVLATLVTWGCVQLHARLRHSWPLMLGIAFNLVLLAFFKYANFFAESILILFEIEFTRWHIVLPLGISFFVFQKVSYLLDVRRGTAPHYTLLEYAAYVAFFPQLIAGPIVRHNELIAQFSLPPRRPETWAIASRGLVLFTLGLIKKVFFADQLAPLADTGFDQATLATAVGAGLAWSSALAYSLQLYFDFSAYSDMALGLAGLFGLSLPINFDAPYRATTLREFWRRWHMTLSRFLRDYLYIPLGGNHGNFFRVSAVVFATMLLCGLWHGAGWTFVVWGGLHGVGLIGYRVWALQPIRLPTALSWACTLLFVIVGWVLFRAETFEAAWVILTAMATLTDWTSGVSDKILPYLAIGWAFAVLGPTNAGWAARVTRPSRKVAIAVGIGLVLVCLRIGQGRGLEFIYFQF